MLTRLLDKLRPARTKAAPNLPRERHEVITRDEANTGVFEGWQDDQAAQLQDAAFEGVLRQMWAGRPRIDFQSAAAALRATGLRRPSLLDVGCGSGYYSEVFACLLDEAVDYTGSDFSAAMIRRAQARYPALRFEVGDGTALPFSDAAFDVVMLGTSLMHMPRYEAAIAQARRVSKRWCLFHTVPVLRKRATTFLRHEAYGGSLVELVFNEAELRSCFVAAGLVLRREFPSIPYDLSAVLGEATTTKSYLCEGME